MELVEKFLNNLDIIEKSFDEEKFELMTETIQLNDAVLRKLQTLKKNTPEDQWEDLEVVKQKLINRQGEVIGKIQKKTKEKGPQFKEMSQKVQASQAYNKMKRY